jgi:hypothetical protein
LAEFATNRTERARLAEQGIAACEQAVGKATNAAAAHYYLGMNLGQLARTRGLSALKLVGRMEREFKVARGLDEQFDYAGPDRNLGYLYLDAPSIGSIGDRSKAHQHLDRATVLSPDFPENRLALAEALLKWNDREAARRELKLLEEALPAAQVKFGGLAWASNWTDWNGRLHQLRKKLGANAPVIQSPRQKE